MNKFLLHIIRLIFDATVIIFTAVGWMYLFSKVVL